MKNHSILVCRDAGALGRELLTRRDLELRWAQSAKEALAAARRQAPSLVLAREALALDYLKGAEGIKAPVVVLLEADGWERREKYLSAGAMALVWAGNRTRVAEAVSEITGLPFSTHPRALYEDVVDAFRGKEKLLLQTVEISTSGVVVRDFDSARVGERIGLDFVMLDPPMSLSAMVIRRDSEGLVGLCFDAITEDDRARLERMIKEEIKKTVRLPEPMDMSAEQSGAYSMDLFSSLGGKGDAPFRALLKEQASGKSGERLPHWLERVSRNLSSVEKKALKDGAPSWASAAIDLRIALGRVIAESQREAASREEGARVLEYCRALGDQAGDASESDLADLTELRASLLRMVYGTNLSPRAATQDLSSL